MLDIRLMRDALTKAIEIIGSSKALAEQLGITAQAVSQWDRVPANWVLEIERLTNVSRHDLRPDIFGPDPAKSEAAA